MTARRPAFARWLDDKNEITRMFLAAGSIPNLVNLAGGLPEPSTYPVEELAELARRAVAEHPGDALSYPPIDGLPALRDALAAKYATPALRLTRDNVLITSGGMQGLDLAGKALLDPGAVIAAQSPAYLGALDAWRPRAPSYRPFFPDRNDFDPDAALAGAQFGYAVPNFSNPTGKLVGRDARAAMVCAARATGTWLVEDDPYGALYFDAAPLPSLQELDAAHETGDGPYDGPVVYMGSLSKQLVPGLRVGWVIAAPEMIAALTVAKQGSDMCTSGLSQRIALDSLEGGAVARALPGILSLYRARRDALCAAMDAHLRPWWDWEVPVGGMFVWAVAKDPAMNTDALLDMCMAEGVCVSPSSVFDPAGEDRRALRLNFTLNPEDKLAEGVRRLAVATEKFVARG